MSDTQTDRADDVAREPGLDPMEDKVERDRAALVSTVETLRARVGATADGYRRRFSPEGMRDGANAYLAEQLRERPLQSVAVAAAAAYPVLRLVSKIPAPIMLLGAGVALAGRGGSAEPRTQIDMRVAHGEAHLNDGPDYRDPDVTTPGGDGTAHGGGTADGGGTLDRAQAAVSGAAQGVTDTASGLASQVGDTASQMLDEGARAAADLRQSALDAGETLADATREGADEVLRTIQRHPFATAGVSLLIGGALAAMLPRSRVEDRYLGETADEARARAREAARQAAESARRVAAAAREEAVDQDLTPQAARETAARAAQQARKAAGDMAEDVAKEAGASTSEAREAKNKTEAEADRAAKAANEAGGKSDDGKSEQDKAQQGKSGQDKSDN